MLPEDNITKHLFIFKSQRLGGELYQNHISWHALESYNKPTKIAKVANNQLYMTTLTLLYNADLLLLSEQFLLLLLSEQQ